MIGGHFYIVNQQQIYIFLAFHSGRATLVNFVPDWTIIAYILNDSILEHVFRPRCPRVPPQRIISLTYLKS